MVPRTVHRLVPGFLDAVTTATHDTNNNPTVLSISWGAPESAWAGQAMSASEQAFQDAGAVGVTICCASGDQAGREVIDPGHLNR